MQLIHSGLVWVMINTLTAQTHGRVLSWNKMFMCVCVCLCVCVYETLFSAPNETHRPRVKKRRLLKGETRCNYQKKEGLEDVFTKAILSYIYHNETLDKNYFSCLSMLGWLLPRWGINDHVPSFTFTY